MGETPKYALPQPQHCGIGMNTFYTHLRLVNEPKGSFHWILNDTLFYNDINGVKVNYTQISKGLFQSPGKNVY